MNREQDKAFVNELKKFNDQQLIGACYQNNMQRVKEFLKKGADINTSIFAIDGNSPLSAAIKTQNMVLINYLFQRGVNVNQRNKRGETALMMAVQRNDVKLFNYLMAKKPNLTLKANNQDGYFPTDKEQLTVFDFMHDHLNKDILVRLKLEKEKALAEKSLSLSPKEAFEKKLMDERASQKQLMKLVQDKDFISLSQQIGKGARFSADDKPLKVAVANNDLEMVGFISSLRYDKHLVDALKECEKRNSLDLAQVILKNSILSKNDMLALRSNAEAEGSLAIKRLLDSKNREEMSLITETDQEKEAYRKKQLALKTMKEIDKISISTLKRRIANGLDINAQAADGWNIMFASLEKNKSFSFIKSLLDLGVNLNLKSKRYFGIKTSKWKEGYTAYNFAGFILEYMENSEFSGYKFEWNPRSNQQNMKIHQILDLIDPSIKRISHQNTPRITSEHIKE